MAERKMNDQDRSRRGRSASVLERRLLGATLCVALGTGCQGLNHADAKREAHQRWNNVRANMKFQLAGQQYQGGYFEDAHQTVAEAINLDPTLSNAYLLLAQIRLELGDLSAANAALNVAEQAGFTSGDLPYTRGVILEQQGESAQALEQYAAAHDLDPSNVDYLIARAECLVMLERPVDALELLTGSAENVADQADIAALAAHIAELLGDSQEAVDQFARAVALRGEDRIIAQELGRLLVRAGRYEEALSILRPLVDALPSAQISGAMLRDVAACQLALGDPVSARAVLVDYASANPNDTAAQLLLAKSAIATSDWMTAMRAVDLASQHDPHRLELRLVRATVRWKRGDYAAAATDLEQLVDARPDDIEAHCLLAEVYHAMQRFDDAWTHFQRALKLDPSCAWAAAGLGQLKSQG